MGTIVRARAGCRIPPSPAENAGVRLKAWRRFDMPVSDLGQLLATLSPQRHPGT